MFIKINYVNDANKEEIILKNKNLFLIEDAKLLTENYLIFSDKKYVSIEQEIEAKISVFEQENKALKEELTQIQTSIASLTSLIATTLEEK